MIRTTLTPQDTNLQLSVDIPEDYVGKKIEVLIFATDEPNEHLIAENNAANHRGSLHSSGALENEPIKQKNKTAKYRGILQLSDEQYSDLQHHVNNIRKE